MAEGRNINELQRLSGLMLDDVGDRSRQLRDAEIRRLLGLWVSECEPQLVHGPNGIAGLALAGDLTHEGPMPIIVPAKTVEIAITWGDAVMDTIPVAMPLEECRRREEAAAKRPLHPWRWA